MNRKILSLIALLLFVGVMIFNVNTIYNKEQTNELILENIEALASSGECCRATKDTGYRTQTPDLCQCDDGSQCWDYDCPPDGTSNDCNKIYCPSS